MTAPEAEEIARLTAQVQKGHPTRGKPILTGFSQGGILSYAMAVLHPEIYALIGRIAENGTAAEDARAYLGEGVPSDTDRAESSSFIPGMCRMKSSSE